MRSARRSSASRRLCSWVRWLRAMMSSAPSAVRRRPPSARSRALTAALSAALPARSKRSCAAVATLLTFWPPGPEAAHERERQLAVRNHHVARRSAAARARSPSAVSPQPVAAPRSAAPGTAAERRRARGSSRRVSCCGTGMLHAVRAEDAPDRAVHVRAHVVHAVHRVGDPEADFQAHAVVVEADEARHRRRIAQDARVILGRLQQQLAARSPGRRRSSPSPAASGARADPSSSS